MSDHLFPPMPPRTSLNGGLKFIGAVEDQWDLYSDKASDYTLGRPIGHGASSIVYQAEYHTSTNQSSPCALKVLDLDSLPINSLQLLRRETQLMSLSKHPNVLRVRGTWMDGHKLYIALRLMRSGSVADVMQYGWPGGVEEEVARCVLKQALEGLNYLHTNGFIHRDVKAANLLIDDDGTVLLGDLGVAASLNEEDSTPMKSTAPSASGPAPPGPTVVRKMSSLGKRKSFVGTPCWMAPEVISQKHYDSKADIWSLGITALELAQGRAPRSRDPPYKVLMKTVEDDPPTLDREGGQFKYSKAFKEIIQSCLMKDPAKRPTAEELLQTPFFKGSKKKSHLVRAVLNGLPPLVDRQERRRVASVITHLSMESWDFSQGGTPSPSASTPRREMRDGLFEMEESVETPQSPEEDKQADFTPSSSSSGYNGDKRAETEDSAPGDSTDDAVSTPSTTPISLSPTNSITLSGRLSKPVAVAPGSSPTPSARDDLSGSPSSFPGLWRKFRGKGVKAAPNKERRQNDPTTKSGIGTAMDEKRRGAGDLMGSILQRSTSRTAAILRA